MLSLRVIQAAGSSGASTVTDLTPVVAVLLGVLVLHERLSWYEPVGGLVVVLGIAVGEGRLRRLVAVPATRSRGRRRPDDLPDHAGNVPMRRSLSNRFRGPMPRSQP